jgi:predicted DNA-binding transcriptional regulator AlpA
LEIKIGSCCGTEGDAVASSCGKNRSGRAAASLPVANIDDRGVGKDELLTVPDVLATLNGVSRRTFYRWRELGNGPKCIRLPNGELRIWRSDFRAWLENCREATP